MSLVIPTQDDFVRKYFAVVNGLFTNIVGLIVPGLGLGRSDTGNTVVSDVAPFAR